MGRSSYEFDGAEDGHEDLEKTGRALLSPPKGKDALLRLLKAAGDALSEAAQASESAKHATRDLAKAVGRSEFLRHKDKEVCLYTALCICHVLRLNAPDSPFSEEQLQSIFELLTRTYAELEEPASPHFQLCLSILETVSQVKCSLLLLDLANAEELVCSLFSTLLDVVNEENAEVLQGTVLELLRTMIEEADDLPQQQLDILLARLLPAAAAESPAAHALVVALLQRTETTVQPHLQKFLKALLTGVRTDSELKDDAYELFYAVHETVPQALLPLEPLLRDEVMGELDVAKRRAAVDLVAKLLSWHPSGTAKILDEYEPLLEAFLGRTNDLEAEVRRKVLEAAPALMEACAGHSKRQLEVLKTAVAKLFDLDDSVRRAAAAAVCTALQQYPQLAGSTHTEGRGPVLTILFGRLRDKKLSVRREVASHLAALLRAWVLAAAESPDAAPHTRTMLSIPLALCHHAVRDQDLGSHVLDTVWRAGIFPAKLAPADVARYWAQMWFQARETGDDHRSMLTNMLLGKLSMQLKVQRLLALRAAAKEQRTSSLTAAASSAGGGSSAVAATSVSTRGGGDGVGHRLVSNPAAHLQSCIRELASVLKEAIKPEEGLQKLLDSKDNHIFRGLATLAAYGCTYKDAVAAGKDVMQRVGSKGPAADLTRVLVARLTPNLVPPEVLHAAMDEAEQSEDVQRFLVAIAVKAPLLLAQSLDNVMDMFEGDDSAVAACAAKVLARAGPGMAKHCQARKLELPQQLPERLQEMCMEGSPAVAKAAATALLGMLPSEQAAAAASELADDLLTRLRAPATLSNHSLLLAALKGLSVVGRLQPEVFESRADEVLDFVVADLMELDMSRGKPLPGVTAHPAAAAGRQWGRPSAVTAIKTAALRTLCQALVPDSARATLTQAMGERAALVWELLEPLLDTEEGEPQFAPFDIVLPNTSDPEHAELKRELRSKRRRVAGGGSAADEQEEESNEEAGDEEGNLASTDAAWVRFSAVCGLLRLARAYDSAMSAPLYANLALAFQEPQMDPRRAMTLKLHKTVTLLGGKREPGYAQRATKYAAILAFFAIDPEPRNRLFALRTLRDYVVQRRLVVERMAASTAAAGGGGGTMIQDMPEAMLAYLVFLLAHHPDFPTPERLEEYSQASPEEQQEVYGEAGPFAPFIGMLQFGLEALAVPSDHPTSASSVSRLLPPSLKVLRTLKYCEDACEEPRTEESLQLCDLGLMLLKLIADRLTNGKHLTLASFPGAVVLPKRCFRALDMSGKSKRLDGSNLPPARYFTPGLFEDDLFLRRLMPALPGPAAKARGKPRGKAGGTQRRGKAAKGEDGAAGGAVEVSARSGEEESSVAHTFGSLAPDWAAEEGQEGQQQQQPRGKRRAPAAKQPPGDGGKRSKPQRGRGSAEGSEADSGAVPAGRAAAAKPAGTPSRQQPRRGAKSEIGAKLKEASTDVEDEEEEEGVSWDDDSQEEQQHTNTLRGAAVPFAARAVVTMREEAEEERVVLRRATAVAIAADAVRVSAPAAAGRLRADTDEEEEEEVGEEEKEREEEQEPHQRKQRQRQQQRRPQKAEQGTVSPNQENRAGANGLAAARGRQQKASTRAAAAPKPRATTPSRGPPSRSSNAREPEADFCCPAMTTMHYASGALLVALCAICVFAQNEPKPDNTSAWNYTDACPGALMGAESGLVGSVGSVSGGGGVLSAASAGGPGLLVGGSGGGSLAAMPAPQSLATRVSTAAIAPAAPSTANGGTLGFATGGAQDVENFRANVKAGYLPLPTDVTYEGIVKDYYFDTSSNTTQPCTELFCPIYSLAATPDPLLSAAGNENDSQIYMAMAVGLDSGLAAADWKRPRLNLVLLLDVSGSMGSPFDTYYYDQFGVQQQLSENELSSTKMDVAKEVLEGIVDKLGPEDSLGIVLFSTDACIPLKLAPLRDTNVAELKRQIERDIEATSSTNMQAGLDTATRELKGCRECLEANPQDTENRIILITDAQPNEGAISVGLDFNTELVEGVSKVRGANYFSVHSPGEFKRRLNDEFDYAVTPLVFDLNLAVDPGSLGPDGWKVLHVYGSPNPNDTALNSNGTVTQVNTLFPAPKTEEGIKGGVVLLRMRPPTAGNAPLQLTVTYTDRAGQTFSNQRTVAVPEEVLPAAADGGDGTYFDSNGVRKAVLLARYTDILHDWLLDQWAAVNSSKPIAIPANLCTSLPSDYCPVPVQLYGQQRINDGGCELAHWLLPDACLLPPPYPVLLPLLGRWERQSEKLAVDPKARAAFDAFLPYFESEAAAVGDASLNQEVELINTILAA
ncbi:Sister chromatid cohesion protein PDS5 B-B [Chlorella vulgaris]